jgi:hypothetical protein
MNKRTSGNLFRENVRAGGARVKLSRLTISRETLRSLTETELELVVGGNVSSVIDTAPTCVTG